MPPIAVFSIPRRQSFGMERSISSNSMESYWTNVASSFRVNKILSPSSTTSNIRCKKDDDDEYDTPMMIYTDDSSLSDNGSDNGNHSRHKSNSSESFHGQQRGFYEMMDDRYSHGNATPKLTNDFEIATTYMDDRSLDLPTSQPSLPYVDSFNSDVDDDVIETFSSNVHSGSPRSVFASKKSMNRMLKVTTQRLTNVSKVKLE